MSTTVAPPSLPLYSVDEYFALVEQGRLDADARVELLEGVIVDISPQTPRHAGAVRLVEAALRAAFPDAIVSGQSPFIASARSGPEPDVAVLPGGLRDYTRSHPTEAFLVVEVADSSLVQDRLTKSRIYAAASVPEYWILNLVDDALEVHRSPDVEARLYRDVTTLTSDESVRPIHAPDSELAVADLLP